MEPQNLVDDTTTTTPSCSSQGGLLSSQKRKTKALPSSFSKVSSSTMTMTTTSQHQTLSRYPTTFPNFLPHQSKGLLHDAAPPTTKQQEKEDLGVLQPPAGSECLDVLYQELVRILYNRQDPMRLEKCKNALETYRGTDWLLHSKVPLERGMNVKGYTRAEVYRQEDFFSLLVLTWSPRAASAIHNHPCDRCFLMPLQGHMSEVRYTVIEKDIIYKEQSCTALETNTAYWIDDAHGWHSVENGGSGLAVSLHLYIPGFSKCKIVDPSTNSIRWANCFSSCATTVNKPLYSRIFEDVSALIQHGDESDDSSSPVLRRLPKPDMETSFSQLGCPLAFSRGCLPTDDTAVLDAVKLTCKLSTNTGHLYFFNQLFSKPDPVAVAADCLATCLNPNMYTFEMAPVFLVMEKELLHHMGSFLGWFRYLDMPERLPTGACVAGRGESHFVREGPKDIGREKLNSWDTAGFDGIFNPGGSVSNLMALNIARYHKFPEVKSKGSRAITEQLIVFTSDQGHESLEKAAAILGLGTESLVCVPVRDDNAMDVAELRRSVAETVRRGELPFFVNCSAGTTVAGAFDPFDEIKQVCAEYDMWMHVDGALGASFLLPPEEPYKTLCRGMNLADSVTWNLHKLLGVPLQCSALLTRHPGLLSASHITRNPTYCYIPPESCSLASAQVFCAASNKCSTPIGWDSAAETVSRLQDSGVRGVVDTLHSTFQSGRRADAFKAWALWKKLGDIGMSNRIRLVYTHTREFAKLLTSFPLKYSTAGGCPGSGSSSEEVVECVEAVEEGMPADGNRKAFALVWQPVSCNCCFWWIPYDLRDRFYADGANEIRDLLDLVAVRMKQHMLNYDEPIMVNFHTVPTTTGGRGGDTRARRAGERKGSAPIASEEGLDYNKDTSQASRLPYFWRVPLVNPHISRDEMFKALCIINKIGIKCFPPRTFQVAKIRD